MLEQEQPREQPSLLAALNFRMEMNKSIEKVLRDSGVTGDVVGAFPELGPWREGLVAYGQAVAATPTPYDQEVGVENRQIPVEESTIRLRIYRPQPATAPTPVLYWMHGGALLGGTPEQDDVQLKQLVAATGATVVAVAYRVAPEHPFPTPLNDCYAGLLWVAEHAEELGINGQKIAVGGASAGAGLAASLALRIRKDGGPHLVHQSLSFPMLDDRNITKSSQQIISQGVFDRGNNVHAWQAYLGTAPDRAQVPEFAVPAREKDLSALPPTYLAVGTLDLFRDEDIEYALRLMEAGVSTELDVYAGAVHSFDWFIPTEAMGKAFFSKRINALKLAFDA